MTGYPLQYEALWRSIYLYSQQHTIQLDNFNTPIQTVVVNSATYFRVHLQYLLIQSTHLESTATY